jgi:phosphatidylglycerophosphate synthase
LNNYIPFYIFIIFISRDAAILIGAAIQMSIIESDTPAPNLLGKLTTSLQIIYISLIFLNEIFGLNLTFNFLDVLIIFVTLLSLLVYALNWYKDLRKYHNE